MDTITINGVERHLGLLPTPAATIARMHRSGRVAFSHEHARLRAARADWQAVEEADCRHLLKIVEDQDSTNMCVGGSGAMSLSLAFAKEGFDIRVCPAAVYAPICGGSDNGASMGDCLEALTIYGAWPAGFEGIAQFDWRSAYRTRFWSNPKSKEGAEAARYRIVESVFCSSLEDWLAGLATGMWSGQFGVGAGGAYEPDGNGFLPRYNGQAINHANTATGGRKKHPATGKMCIEAVNPWGDWGPLRGFYYCDPFDWLDIAGQELWLCRATTLPQ